MRRGVAVRHGSDRFVERLLLNMTTLIMLIAFGALFVAFSNGANDNFKGFATIWGSQSLSYRQALWLATIATLAGSMVSLVLANGLIAQFSGKGLVPDMLMGDPAFVAAVAIGAAATVIAATRLGMPVSTTHALLGGLMGGGLALSSSGINVASLGKSFIAPLLFSPIAAAMLGAAAYQLLRLRRPNIDCACITAETPIANLGGEQALYTSVAVPRIVIAPMADCERLPAQARRLPIPAVLRQLHLLSAASICFARAVNDTPKIVALLLVARVSGVTPSVSVVAVAMAAGGLLLGRRVAETMSFRLNRLDDTQGLSANLITAFLVILASRFGLPVSTTHVSVGSIAGVGADAGTLHRKALANVLLSWVVTLPLAAGLAWAIALLARFARV